MTREEAIYNLHTIKDKYTWSTGADESVYMADEALDMAIKALEQEPCDAISRQAVLSMQYRIDDSATLSTRDVVDVDDIEDLPSVTPHYTDTEIQKMQEMEQAEIQKAYELGRTSQPKTAEQKGDFSSEQI